MVEAETHVLVSLALCIFLLFISDVLLFVKSRLYVWYCHSSLLHSVINLEIHRDIPFQKTYFKLDPLIFGIFPCSQYAEYCMTGWKVFPHTTSYFFAQNRSKKDKAKAGVKPDTSDQEPEGLTLLVPDIQKTAEIVYAATTSLRQANQGDIEILL